MVDLTCEWQSNMKIEPFRLERFYSRFEFTTQYLLCSSDCEAMHIHDLLSMEEGAHDKFMKQWLGYTETQGSHKLREEITKLYSSASPAQVLVFSGAEEPIFLLWHALLEAEDEVIVQFPCYQSAASVPESIGCKVKPWRARFENGAPFFDISELRRLINSKTRAIYINSPHNPTGHHFDERQYAEIVSLCQSVGAVLISDEVYRELELDPSSRLPAIVDVYERGVSIGVMSKAYGLAGLRIGWLASKDDTLLRHCAMLKEYTTICNAAPSEFLAEVALRNRYHLLNRNLEIIRHNIPLLNDFFHRYQEIFDWHSPSAGSIGFPKWKLQLDGMALAEDIVRKKNVLILPGEVYDQPGFFRVGFGRRNMPEALGRFEEYVNEELISKHR